MCVNTSMHNVLRLMNFSRRMGQKQIVQCYNTKQKRNTVYTQMVESNRWMVKTIRRVSFTLIFQTCVDLDAGRAVDSKELPVCESSWTGRPNSDADRKEADDIDLRLCWLRNCSSSGFNWRLDTAVRVGRNASKTAKDWKWDDLVDNQNEEKIYKNLW